MHHFANNIVELEPKKTFILKRNLRSLVTGFHKGALFICLLYCLISSPGLIFANQSLKSDSSFSDTILQGAILVKQATPSSNSQLDRIQPGQGVKVTVLVENMGATSSPSGCLFVQFAFAKPLQEMENSLVFETEKVSVPSLQPHSSIEIQFEKIHKWPSLPDFIRQDWAMREYQAIFEWNNQKQMLGSLAITFSAYYYPGVRKELPAKIS